jgi:small GTP-binding protein
MTEIRVLVCGTAKCGKSTFLRNFRDKNPRKKYKPTFYQHYNDKFVQVLGHTIHIDAWDTGVEGHENIGFMRCDAAIICFDISDPDSMKSITSTNVCRSPANMLNTCLTFSPFAVVQSCNEA